MRPHDARLSEAARAVACVASGQVILMTDTERVPRTGTEAVAAVRREIDGLAASLRLRTVIEQAKGVLAARHGITPDEAFERLRELSQQHNVRLAEVAATLVGVALPEEVPGPGNDRRPPCAGTGGHGCDLAGVAGLSRDGAGPDEDRRGGLPEPVKRREGRC